MRQTAIALVRFEEYREKARRLRDVAGQTIERLGATEVAGVLGITPPALHMAADARDNRDIKLGWLAALLDMDTERALIRELCRLAGGEFVHTDQRTDREKLAALKEQVRDLGAVGSKMLREAGL